MQTVNDYFVFMAKPKSISAGLDIDDVSGDFDDKLEQMQDQDLSRFIVPGDYVKQESKRQKKAGIIDYESDQEEIVEHYTSICMSMAFDSHSNEESKSMDARRDTDLRKRPYGRNDAAYSENVEDSLFLPPHEN